MPGEKINSIVLLIASVFSLLITIAVSVSEFSLSSQNEISALSSLSQYNLAIREDIRSRIDRSVAIVRKTRNGVRPMSGAKN